MKVRLTLDLNFDSVPYEGTGLNAVTAIVTHLRSTYGDWRPDRVEVRSFRELPPPATSGSAPLREDET